MLAMCRWESAVGNIALHFLRTTRCWSVTRGDARGACTFRGLLPEGTTDNTNHTDLRTPAIAVIRAIRVIRGSSDSVLLLGSGRRPASQLGGKLQEALVQGANS